ncbi:protein broad-minded-like [Anneissia japonica]|uniref:protein broad-minded-like n=1 Tax=Anneissia japonica TaxID=1529436 RepID=UPI0014255E29|nr:protein broad-minded-like [Anneissia japonica]XP_033110987.1 protein broad-minded-like [Anneissia japonica]
MADSRDVDLLPSIRQLITKIEPAIQSADSLEAAEDTILHLEATDENFHRYEYVKYIRQHMDKVLGSLIEEQMEKHTHKMHAKGSEEDLVRAVTQHVVNDQTYSEMMQNLKQHTKDSVERLLLTFDEDHSDCPMREAHSMRDSPKRCSFEFSEGSSSSFDSSFNQGFMFMNQGHFVTISENLEPLKALKTRQDAITKLCQIPPSDVLACDQWEHLRAGLTSALGDTDQCLEEKSLQFHAKMFSAKSHTISKEVYTSLVDYLCSQFPARKGKSMYLKDGLDVNNPSIKSLLRKFRLLNEFQIEVPSYWVRFPENFVEDILEKTVKLIDINSHSLLGSMEIVCPVHFIALLDPKARWFKKWMHGHYSRTFVLKSLRDKPGLVENALRQCMEFIAKSENLQDPVNSITNTFDKQKIGDTYSTFYSEKDLKFVHFVHSLSLIGRILMYAGGRNLFPISSKYGPVSIQDLMVSLVTLLTDSSTTRSSRSQDKLNPAILVTNTFKMLCSAKEACHKCFCTNVFIGHLIKPVLEWLDDDPNDVLPQEATLLHIGDILTAIASWEAGRHILLYGENGKNFKENRSAAVHIIAEFSRRALNGTFSSTFGLRPSRAVAGAYLYLCRQLYNTCEGRLALHPYKLHTIVVNAWKEAVREVQEATPTPGAEDGNPVCSASEGAVAWENTLIDNLLNFAGTPKGLLFLQQTGAMNECVTYMYTRYAKKLQVSKTEKFGYGTMVTQVAATAAGMAALQGSGFIKRIVNELWTVLECGRDDRPVLRPSHTPVDPIDRTAHKSFTSLVNVLSAFPAVYEVIADQVLKHSQIYTFREMPDTIVDIIERLILVDSDSKAHSLFNMEQSHTFGLRLLSIMVCSLDTLLLLESQYSIWSTLLRAQQDNKADNGDIIIDMLSVERNQILVRSYTIGGPSERVLPPKTLDIDSEHPYPWPLFSSFPVPKDYIPFSSRPSAMKQENELSRLISGLRPSNLNTEWLNKFRHAFFNVMTNKPDHITPKVIPELLESIVAAMITTGEDKIFPIKACTINDTALKGQTLSSLQNKGVKLSIRYGMYLRLLSNHDEALENLAILLKKCRHYLRMQQRTLNSDLRFLQRDYVGFDWFAASVFLMMAGNKDKAWNFLYHFSTLASSGFLWMPRLYASVHLPLEQTISGIHPVFSSTGHNVELILQQEVSHVYSAFKMSGYTPSQICQHWLTQSFWNYLDWQQICHYILVCILFGVDYQVYICIAILRFMRPHILQHRQQQNLQVFLKEESIVGFKVGQHLQYMKSLEEKYRATILPDMVNLAKQ